MKITTKIFSVPPYLSTSWEKVSTLRMSGRDLIVTLTDGTSVTLRDLQPDVIELIFSTHATFLEQQTAKTNQIVKSETVLPLSSGGFRVALGSFEAIGQMLQHNPEHSHLPPLPPDAVNKITQLSKMIPPEDILAMPSPEEGCNCLFCQMGRILRQSIEGEAREKQPEEEEEEEVRDEDLRFDQWFVEPLAEKLYLVTNKLDPLEQYRVFLGDPIGCTCGKANCEHIIAVLRH